MTKEEHSVISGNFEQGTAREIMETVVRNNTCDLVDDRDNWKARAEAYKSALDAGQCCIACDKRPGCGQILSCERFKLDEERFGKENGGTNA